MENHWLIFVPKQGNPESIMELGWFIANEKIEAGPIFPEVFELNNKVRNHN